MWIKTLILTIRMLPSKAKSELYSVLDDPQENFNVARKPDNAEVLENELCELKNTIRDEGSTANKLLVHCLHCFLCLYCLNTI